MVLDMNEVYKLEISLLLASKKAYHKQTEMNLWKE